MTWGGPPMGAGRRVACAHCVDPLLVQPNELDALEHGDVRCPRCGRALNANDLFREMTTASAFTQLQLTSNWWEADQLEVRVGVVNCPEFVGGSYPLRKRSPWQHQTVHSSAATRPRCASEPCAWSARRSPRAASAWERSPG